MGRGERLELACRVQVQVWKIDTEFGKCITEHLVK